MSRRLAKPYGRRVLWRKKWRCLWYSTVVATSAMLGPIALHNLTTLYDANPNVTTSATYEELEGPGDDDCVNALFE